MIGRGVLFDAGFGGGSWHERAILAVATLTVFAVGVALRVPGCEESFWVDELHTAWAVWDGPAEVAGRASLGNQTPFYFWGVWVWKSLFGGGEVALRMSSVLAVSLAAAWLCFGIGVVFRRVGSGFAAGMVLAVERNAIFFGTELRPYAWVLLAAAVAAVAFAAAITRESRGVAEGTGGEPEGTRSAGRHSTGGRPVGRRASGGRSGGRRVPRVGLLAALVAAGLLQPTSLGVLGLPPLLLSLRRRFVLPLLATMALVAAILWPMTLGEVWRRREQWSGFASAGSILDAWQIWDWIPLVVAPAAVWMVSCLSAWRLVGFRFWVWGVIVVGSTLAYWGASYFGGVPVWHRRYVIAVLPFFAVISGEAVAAVGRGFRGCRGGRYLVAAAAVGLPTGVAWYQGTLADVWSRSPLVRRGEDWRGAAAWLRARVDAGERVYLMSGLIEAPRYLERGWRPRVGTTRDELEYLRFPLRGPYRLGGSETSHPVTPHPVRGDATFATDWLDPAVRGPGEERGDRVGETVGGEIGGDETGSVYLVARLPAGHLGKWFDAVAETIDPRLALEEIEIRGFGGVSVARLPIRERGDDRD